YLIPALLGLTGCETAAEIAAREQIDTACLTGNLQACALVERRVAARNRDGAIMATAPMPPLKKR
ncbi:MAG: hypothetical protein AAFO70_02325, partial [Pseudomonadota bacterium]